MPPTPPKLSQVWMKGEPKKNVKIPRDSNFRIFRSPKNPNLAKPVPTWHMPGISIHGTGTYLQKKNYHYKKSTIHGSVNIPFVPWIIEGARGIHNSVSWPHVRAIPFDEKHLWPISGVWEKEDRKRFWKKHDLHTVWWAFLFKKLQAGVCHNHLKQPLKLEKPCITKGLATCHFLGLIFPCNKVLMVDPDKLLLFFLYLED